MWDQKKWACVALFTISLFMITKTVGAIHIMYLHKVDSETMRIQAENCEPMG